MSQKDTDQAAETKHSHVVHVPWGPAAAIIMSIGTYFFSQILTAFVLAVVLFSLGWTQARIQLWFDGVAGKFVQIVAVEACVLFILFVFLRHRKASFKTLGLIKPKALDIWSAAKGFAIYLPLNLVVLHLVSIVLPNVDLNQEQELGFSTSLGGLSLLVVFVSLVVLPPLVEEILTRGFLYTGLRTKLRFIPAALITSVLFAAAHLQWGSEAPLLWAAAIDTFILSLVLVYLREKTGSLWPAIGLHGLKNCLAFMLLFVFKVG